MRNERILFMGTPEFAVATLNALVADGLNVCAVVTAPDRPAGRGRQLRSSAVKLRALELGIPVLQPERLKDPAFLAQLDHLDALLYVVVAFRMLPEVVWSKPRYGTVNLHGSLLPAYRGAAPINWAVIHGEPRTGVTTFMIQHEIDTGGLLLQDAIGIGPEETAGDVHDRLMIRGGDLMVRTVHGLLSGGIEPAPQVIDPSAPPRTAPKINAENTRIHFNRPAREVHDHVRGLSPYPGAWCEWIDGGSPSLHCKLLRTRPSDMDQLGIAGTLRIVEGQAFVACNDGWIELLELQLEGRRRMSAAEWMRGLHGTVAIHLQ